MLTCVISHYTAKVYRRGESIYHASLNRAMTAGGQDDWRVRTVKALIKPASAVVSEELTVQQLFAQLPKRPVSRVYVTDGDDLVAWLDPRRAAGRRQAGRSQRTLPLPLFPVRCRSHRLRTCRFSAALEGFLREQVAVLPVTLGQWRNTLIGEVSKKRHDLLLAAQDRLTYPK